MIATLRGIAERWGSLRPGVRWGLPLAWAATIWFLSSQSPSGHGSGVAIALLFNGGHVVLFGGLAALIHLASPAAGRRRFLIAVSLAALYGVVDEVHQMFVPRRDASVFDWTTDACGAVLVAAALSWLRERPRWALATALAALPASGVSVLLATFA